MQKSYFLKWTRVVSFRTRSRSSNFWQWRSQDFIPMKQLKHMYMYQLTNYNLFLFFLFFSKTINWNSYRYKQLQFSDINYIFIGTFLSPHKITIQTPSHRPQIYKSSLRIVDSNIPCTNSDLLLLSSLSSIDNGGDCGFLQHISSSIGKELV